MSTLSTIGLNKAEIYLVQYLNAKGVNLKKGEIQDFSLTGEEEERDIEQYADDFLSELASERAEYAATAQERYDEQNEQDCFDTEAGNHMRSGYSENARP